MRDRCSASAQLPLEARLKSIQDLAESISRGHVTRWNAHSASPELVTRPSRSLELRCLDLTVTLAAALLPMRRQLLLERQLSCVLLGLPLRSRRGCRAVEPTFLK